MLVHHILGLHQKDELRLTKIKELEIELLKAKHSIEICEIEITTLKLRNQEQKTELDHSKSEVRR